MWAYDQKTGAIRHNDVLIGTGYSGHAAGRDNPDLQAMRSVGPIPRGRYEIGPPHDTATHGPHVMRLTQLANTDTFGRDGFLWHGDSATHDASLGCIVSARDIRDKVSSSGDNLLEVT